MSTHPHDPPASDLPEAATPSVRCCETCHFYKVDSLYADSLREDILGECGWARGALAYSMRYGGRERMSVGPDEGEDCVQWLPKTAPEDEVHLIDVADAAMQAAFRLGAPQKRALLAALCAVEPLIQARSLAGESAAHEAETSRLRQIVVADATWRGRAERLLRLFAARGRSTRHHYRRLAHDQFATAVPLKWLDRAGELVKPAVSKKG